MGICKVEGSYALSENEIALPQIGSQIEWAKTQVEKKS